MSMSAYLFVSLSRYRTLICGSIVYILLILFVFMCVYICIYMCNVYIYVYVYIYMCVCVCMCILLVFGRCDYSGSRMYISFSWLWVRHVYIVHGVSGPCMGRDVKIVLVFFFWVQGFGR